MNEYYFHYWKFFLLLTSNIEKNLHDFVFIHHSTNIIKNVIFLLFDHLKIIVLEHFFINLVLQHTIEVPWCRVTFINDDFAEISMNDQVIYLICFSEKLSILYEVFDIFLYFYVFCNDKYFFPLVTGFFVSLLRNLFFYLYHLSNEFFNVHL